MTALDRAGAERGLGRYVRTIERALRATGVQLRTFSLGPGGRPRFREWFDLRERHVALRRIGAEIYHAPTPYSLPPGDLARTVVSILDVIPLDVPGYLRLGAKAKYFFRRAGRAGSVLTLSAHGAERVSALLGVDPARIVVAPLPVDSAFRQAPGEAEIDRFLAAYGLSRFAYLTSLGDFSTRDPRKRLEWLPEIGHAVYRATGMPLVVAGAGSAESLGPGGDVRGLGRIDDASLACLFAGASAFVYTSAYEGQGLPALEAISVGTPVVCMRNSALPEVVGSAGVLVEESDHDGAASLTAACSSLLGDRRMLLELRAQIVDRRPNTTEADFGLRILNAYERAGWTGRSCFDIGA